MFLLQFEVSQIFFHNTATILRGFFVNCYAKLVLIQTKGAKQLMYIVHVYSYQQIKKYQS